MSLLTLFVFLVLGFASTGIENKSTRAMVVVLCGGAIYLLTAASCHAQPDPLTEIRYCGPPVRLANGTIRRRADVLAAFRRYHPCPATLRTTGACPGWSMNHVIPLACGGCDAVWNLSWLTNDIKSVAGPHAVDRFERRIYAASPPVDDTASCKLEIVP